MKTLYNQVKKVLQFLRKPIGIAAFVPLRRCPIDAHEED